MAKRSDFEYYIGIAGEMIDNFIELRNIQEKLDKMSRLEWTRPAGMDAPWMRDFKTTAPFDAIKTGVRVLSGLDERITIDPYGFDETENGDLNAAKLKANAWEIALKWQMDRASRRRAILRQDVVRSAMQYDEIVGQVVHLPTQIKAIKKMGGRSNRQEAALRYGDFAILLRNPKNVYTKYSDYMLEAVLYATVRDVEDIQNFWNNPQLTQLIDEDRAPKEWVLLDYVDYDRRVVFCYPGSTVRNLGGNSMVTVRDEEGEDEEYGVVELMNEEWKYDFLPWAAVVGGTQLDSAPENARFPLLYGILKADQWNNTNIIGTLMMSEAIAEAARPDVARIGLVPDSVEATYGEPGGTWDVPVGHEIRPMPDKGLDPALREALDRQLSDMGRATIPQVLVTAEALPQEPFAGFNHRIQQAMASLMPYKFLAERWFEEAYRLMLYWAKESNKGIVGHNTERGIPRTYEIVPADIDKDKIYLKVELQTDVPLDRQQKMATAIQASRELKMPTRDILEMLGETNPERKVKDWMMEQLDFSYLQGVLQQIAADASGAIQQQAMQIAQQMLGQIAQQAQQQGGPPGQGEQPSPLGPQGIEGIEGGSVNPAEGGAPPAGFAPGATFEGQTGMTRTGEEVMA